MQGGGVGAQIEAAASLILFAHDHRMRYVHWPLRRVEHDDGQSGWADRWERFFNFGLGELTIWEAIELAGPPRFADWLHDVRRLNVGNFYVTRNGRLYAHTFPNRYRSILERLREKYNSTPKPTPRLSPKQVNIAVHVRRGDIGHDNYRYTANDVIVRRLRNVLAATGPSLVHIYSEGKPSEFGPLQDVGELYLDGCPFQTFHDLVSADVLMTSRSSFSYVAALLSKGVKVYEPGHFPGLRAWISQDDPKLAKRLLAAL